MNRFNRRRFFTIISTSLAVVVGSVRSLFSQTVPTTLQRQSRGSGRVPTLKKQLEAGLKARRSVEFQFIADVVKLVETRKLPLQMVVETFHYARSKKRGYPFQYFQRALVLRARRIGVTISAV